MCTIRASGASTDAGGAAIVAAPGEESMSKPPSWDPYGPQDPDQYGGQAPYRGQSYQGRTYPGQPLHQGQPHGSPVGQQAYPDRVYGNGYYPESPQRMKRHRISRAITGAAIVVIGIIVAALIVSGGNGNHNVTTGQAAATRTSSTSKASNLAKIGSAIVLTGNKSGEKIAVTVVRLFRHPQPTRRIYTPPRGDQLYAVQLRLDDIGSAAYSGTLSNGATLVDTAGQSYQSSLDKVAECQSFPATENIAVGSSRLGCIVFEVPTTARITEVQFRLHSGMARPQTGQWNVNSDPLSSGGLNWSPAVEPTFSFPGDPQCRIRYRNNGNRTMSWTANVTVAGELITHAASTSGNIYRHNEQVSPGLSAFTAPVQLSQVSDISGVLYVPHGSSWRMYDCSVTPQR